MQCENKLDEMELYGLDDAMLLYEYRNEILKNKADDMEDYFHYRMKNALN